MQKHFCPSLTSYRSWCMYLCQQVEDNHLVALALEPYGHSSIVMWLLLHLKNAHYYYTPPAHNRVREDTINRLRNSTCSVKNI